MNNDINVLNEQLSAEDKARRRHRFFIKSVITIGILCALGIIGVIGYTMMTKNNKTIERKNLIAQVEPTSNNRKSKKSIFPDFVNVSPKNLLRREGRFVDGVS